MSSGMTAPSPAALRMRRSRERRRQGDVMAILEVGPSATADLVALGWLPAPDCVDKDILARALVGLINRAIEMRVTPRKGSEGVCFTPLRVILHRQHPQSEHTPGLRQGLRPVLRLVRRSRLDARCDPAA
jgi:hypothetical protein